MLSLALTLAAAPDEVSDADRKHWAFQPLTRPAIPVLSTGYSVLRTPIDAFLLAKLQAKGLSFSPDADRQMLIRRAYLDLLGFPPPPEAVEAFLKDTSADAYEKLLDRLLASPHFGERWGRHWLDGAGYVDVTGGDNDAAIIKLGESKWRYRDYVIRALNHDKPFDRFLTEQIAGDELVDWRSAPTFTPEIMDLLVATGFLRTAADDTDENELNTLDIRHGVLQRTGEVLASNLLGLTLNCAKCHDHKYEPILQRDYYRMLSLLQPALNPDAWLQPKQRLLPDISPTEKAAIERHNGEIDRQAGDLRKRLAEVRRPYEGRLLAAKLAKALPDPIRVAVEAARKLKPEEVTPTLSAADRAASSALEQQIAELNGRKRGWGHLQVVYDTGAPTPTRLLKRGNHLAPAEEVAPGFLSVLCSSAAELNLSPSKAEGKSGRRRTLARWLTDVRSPAGALVLRVRVNRVWQHLFGRGIVETADNFGVTGTPPTHPELLDWVAAEFAANGQRLKPFLKLLMTSTAYRQTSAASGMQKDDPDNRLLGRQRLRRLESEVVRDSILAVSGRLDATPGGPPVPVEPRPDGTFVVPDNAPGRERRSVYLLARRNYHPTLLNAFDQPNLTTNCTRRSPSAVVGQALTMLNDRFVLEQAGHLAERVIRSTGAEGRIDAAFRITLGRPSKPEERTWCAELLKRHGDRYRAENPPNEQAERLALTHLCHVLLNTSEFLYVP